MIGSSWRRLKMKLDTGFSRDNKLCVDRRRDALYVYGIYDDRKSIPKEFSGFALLAMSRRSKSNLPTIFSAVSKRKYDRRRKIGEKETRRPLQRQATA